MKSKTVSALLSILILIGCSFAPAYKQPDAPVPEEWPGGGVYEEALSDLPRGSVPPLRWREHFPDLKLQRVIEMALENNRDLRIAALNVERARAMYGIRRAELLPTVDATGGYTRERVPEDLSMTGHAMTREQYSVGLAVPAWELDFFGRIRNLRDSALEEYFSLEQARRAALSVLISEVANTWFALAADNENLELARSTLEAQEASYRLMNTRYENGVASELDLQRARTQVESARRDESLFMQLVAQGQNALSLLTGAQIPVDDLPSKFRKAEPPQEVSPGLSSEILLSRPDVLSAEHRLKAAHANIGAARAAFFPRITLTSTVGTTASDLSGLFESGSGAWSFVPQLTIPIFDPRVRLAYEISKVEREMVVAEYEKVIQTAFREVADILAVRGTLNRRIEAQKALVDAMERTFLISESRYTDGIDSYLSVLDAQRSLYAAEQGLIGLQLEWRMNLVGLYKALGGWQ